MARERERESVGGAGGGGKNMCVTLKGALPAAGHHLQRKTIKRIGISSLGFDNGKSGKMYN